MRIDPRIARYSLLLAFIATYLSGPTIAADDATRLPLPDRPHFAIEHFGERFGLSSATVIALAQDPQGFLWIGGQTGIYRYDGVNVTLFGLSEGLPSLHTLQLIVAPDGTLWARMRKGLARLQGDRFVSLPIPPEAGSLTSNSQSFAVDSSGRVFVSVEKGLLIIDSKSGMSTILGPDDGAPMGGVEAIVRGPDDSIWFVAARHLARILPGTLRPEIFSSTQLPPDLVTSLLMDGHGQLWIRTLKHCATLDVSNPSSHDLTFHDMNLPGANNAGGPVLDRHGDIMLPTSLGLYRWQGKDWQVISHANGLTSSAVFSALEDREGTIWVGLAGAGLDRWPGSAQWSGWIDDGGLPDPLVLGVVRDGRQRLWVATNTALSMWDGKLRHWQVWNKSNGMPASGTLTLFLARDGGLWALSPGAGISWFDTTLDHPAPITVVKGKDALGISRFAMSPDGAIWWNGESSLHFIRGPANDFVASELPIPDSIRGTTQLLSFSSSGALWTGGPAGLAHFDGSRWQRYGLPDGLLNLDVRSVAATENDDVWFGYGDEYTVAHAQIGQDGKLQVQHVPKGACLLGVDRAHNTWLEMYDSVGMLSPGRSLRNFTQSDGLLWNDSNCGAFWQESDGTLLIGTSRGLARYDPVQEDLPHAPPAVVLTHAVFAGAQHLSETHPQIPYKQNSFEAQFAALTFRDPDRVQRSYQLKALDQRPTITALREVRYSSLPPGVYTFEVSCSSPNLGWSATPATYAFTILAPWWRKPSTEVLAVVLLLLLILIFTRLRTRHLESERVRLEAAVAERSTELARANHELEEASLTDPLTGVRNRRFFYSTITADANQADRAHHFREAGYSQDHRDLIFYLIDLDDFKKINDSFGHDAGDEVLVEVARRLSHIVRRSDFLIRWGGEEFLVVCRSADRKNAAVLAEKILRVIGHEPFSISAEKQVSGTCSIGWAPYPWESEGATGGVEEVLKLADRGLYRAKELGRNRAVGMLPPELIGVNSKAGSAAGATASNSGQYREFVSPGPGAS